MSVIETTHIKIYEDEEEEEKIEDLNILEGNKDKLEKDNFFEENNENTSLLDKSEYLRIKMNELKEEVIIFIK
jgi:hypothetical protein